MRADLHARAAQASTVVFVVAGVVTVLLLAAALLEGATNPWRALFTQTRGADVWLRLDAGTPARQLAALPGVTRLAGPYRTTAATLVHGPGTAPVQMWALGPSLPTVGRPLVRDGHWLTAHQPSGVVMEASFAQAMRVRVGSTLTVEGLDGSSVAVRVAGLAETSVQGFYPAQAPGLMWVLPRLIRRVEPVSRHTGEMVGLRLADPGAAGFVVQEAVTRLGSAAVVSVSTWRNVEQSMAGSDPLLGLLLALSGLVALGGALLAIGNAAAGRVLTQLQDLAMLKTLGFTPGQIVGMLITEHGILGLAGTGIGIVAAQALTVALSRQAPVGPLAVVAPLPGYWVTLVAGGTELAVLLATAVPGLRAGRVWPVAAVTPPVPRGRLSRLARVGLLTRLPPALVLGTRAAFTRRLPALLTIAALALPMAMITIGIGFWTTLGNVQRHPGEVGLAAALTVRPGPMSDRQAAKICHNDPGVAAVYRSVTVSALLPGETSAITTLGVGTSARPYPFHVAAGRIYRAPGEAVATQGLLDAVGVRVGQYLRMPVGGVPVIFHIVGRIIDPDYGGQVLAYGIDTLTQAGAVPPPVSYQLMLRSGARPAAVAAHLARISRGRLDVAEAVDPAASLGIIRPMLGGLFAVLGLIALSSLLTAAGVGFRDHLRDIGALRAVGLTPGQVMACMVVRMSVLALIASVAGAVCGTVFSTRLINLASQAYGIGAGLGMPPSPMATTAAAVAAVVAAAVAALMPAYRAARMPVALTLAPN